MRGGEELMTEELTAFGPLVRGRSGSGSVSSEWWPSGIVSDSEMNELWFPAYVERRCTAGEEFCGLETRSQLIRDTLKDSRMMGLRRRRLRDPLVMASIACISKVAA